MLSAESTDHLVLLELTRVSVNQSSPLVHLMSSFLVELVVEVVVLLLQLLRQFPNHIVFELKQLPLFLIVFHEYPPLGQLSGQIIRIYLNLNLKLFRNRILNILINLSVFMQKR